MTRPLSGGILAGTDGPLMFVLGFPGYLEQTRESLALPDPTYRVPGSTITGTQLSDLL